MATKKQDPITETKERIHLRLSSEALKQGESLREAENRPTFSNMIEWLVNAEYKRRNEKKTKVGA